MTPSSPSQPGKRSWVRKVLFAFGGQCGLLVLAYFVVTSSAFFKGVILPRSSKAVGGQVTAARASISPFSQVHLWQLKVQTTGSEPILQAEEVRLRYSLFSILGGTMKVDEVTVVSPLIQVFENADGTSNLDPTLKAQQGKPRVGKSAAPAKSSKAVQVDLMKFALTGATIRKVKLYANGNRDVTQLSNVNVTLDDLKNGQTGKLELSADVKMDSNPPAPGVAGSADARLTGSIGFAFSAGLKPATVKGNVHFLVNNAQGALGELASGVTLQGRACLNRYAIHLAQSFRLRGGRGGVAGFRFSGLVVSHSHERQPNRGDTTPGLSGYA
jgi:uncharacterized protein involved in outer membrane biogenesis